MTKDEALKLALEALESCDAAHITDGGRQWYDEKLVDKAITAIEKCLANDAVDCEQLSEEEIENTAEKFWDDHFGYSDFDLIGFARAIEVVVRKKQK